jgi:outer membrane protein OmpA-like peptidoglycan-associated protein
MFTRIFLGLFLLSLSAGLCQAGWFEDTLGNTGKQLVNRAVRESSNSAYDASKGEVRDTVKGDKNNDSESPEHSPQSGSRQKMEGTLEATTAEVTSIEDAEKISSKYDFIPGDKTVFFDDFSDTDVGEFPRKWTLDGPKQGRNNTVEVVEFQGRHFLRSVPGDKNQSPATQYLRLDQKGDFPEKFTIEFDAVLSSINNSPVYEVAYKLLLVPSDKKIDIFKSVTTNAILISGQENESANTKTVVDLNDGKVHHVAISVNGTFVKAYIDRRRVINDPDAVKRPIKQIGIQMLTPNYFRSEKLLFTNVRLAEGGKDIKSALDTEGKIITHGILFDTGKSTLKPESLPTLKMILGLLNEDPQLKFSIEGHTDNHGGTEINQTLSEQRADSVRDWLERKEVGSDRLKTAGFGDTSPIDNNKTAEGRANNRRVEFVKF